MAYWSTISVPGNEQFALWRDMLAQSINVYTAATERGAWNDAFPCHNETMAVDDIYVAQNVLSPQQLIRGKKEFSQDKCEMIMVVLGADTHYIEYDRGAYEVRSGDLLLLDNRKPFTISITHPETTTLSALIPRHRLQPLLRDPDRCMHVNLTCVNNGLGQMARVMFQQLYTSAKQLDLVGQRLVVDHLIALLGAAASRASYPQGDRGESMHQALFVAISQHIDVCLTDSSMNATSVAKRFNISSRYLHKLFEAQEQSFAQTVIDRRLRRFAHLLVHGQSETTIAETAYQCGFGDLSHFCRIFRRAFGVSPREYRSTAMSEKEPSER
ncbi:helix-turn-helix domain-containing protein [Pandoraea sp. NPDC087047]|uniref:helix-turn-helix domain-containing protein n=1 Tax=Pandoraea sp. NPDC087047 TaxID=3364390 RepID=UPI003812B657